MFHSRCLALEHALRQQVADLQEQARSLRDSLDRAIDSADRVRESYESQLRELHELLLAVQNPGVYRNMQAARRSSQPAAPLPLVPAEAVPAAPSTLGSRINYPTIQPGVRQTDRSKVKPALTPDEARFRAGKPKPVQRFQASPEAIAAADPDSDPDPVEPS